jgi:predicted nucleic acid-binding protein
LEGAEVVSPQTRITRITEDPTDNRVLEAAVEGQADYIVSGDGHLLDLREHDGIPIVTPRDFLAILATEANE